MIHAIFRSIFPHKHPTAVKRAYGMPESINFTIRLTPDGWFVVKVPELPGLITEANNHQGLLEMMNDALLTYYDVPRKEADIVYDRINVGNQVIQYQGKLQTREA